MGLCGLGHGPCGERGLGCGDASLNLSHCKNSRVRHPEHFQDRSHGIEVVLKGYPAHADIPVLRFR